MPWSPRLFARRAVDRTCRSVSPREYSTSVWKRVRIYKLRTSQRCERCRARLSEEVHHRNGNAYDNRPSNLLALCKSCHSSITVNERIKKGR